MHCMVWGYVLATISTLGFILTLTGMLARVFPTSGTSELGILFMLIVMIPAMIGFSASSCGYEKHLINPLSLRIAITWNLLIVLSFAALMVYGITKSV